MEGNIPKVFVGFIIYGGSTAKYLPHFLISLKAQDLGNLTILAFNNGDEEGENIKHIKEGYPEVEIMGNGSNLGFSAAYNLMIKKAVEAKADYFWVTNSDIIYNPDALARMISRLENDLELGAACPKLLKWNFEKKEKTSIVDTYGLELGSGLSFSDIGQGEADRFDFRYYTVLGPSGASGLYRLAALEKIKEKKNYFDENMFMYKEDCDLAYRLFLAEWETAVVPEAVGWHDRTASISNGGFLSFLKGRQQKSRQIRAWSFKNQQIIFWKYWKLQKPADKVFIIIFELKALLYIILFERFLWPDFLEFLAKRKNFTRYG